MIIIIIIIITDMVGFWQEASKDLIEKLKKQKNSVTS